MTKIALAIETLQAGYRDLTILRDISLDVRYGEILGIFGPNGAGKSTLLRAIAGFASVQKGSITMDGRRIDNLPPYLRARLGLSYVSGGVFPEMSVLENLRVAARCAGGDLDAALDRILNVFPLLRPQVRVHAGRLSGGQRRMLAIGMGLINEHSCLLLDEPSDGLAPNAVDSIFESIAELGKADIGVVVVEQNIKALELVGRGYVIAGGRITASGNTGDLRASREFRRAYFGTESDSSALSM